LADPSLLWHFNAECDAGLGLPFGDPFRMTGCVNVSPVVTDKERHERVVSATAPAVMDTLFGRSGLEISH
jgi:hypothetical protein